MHFSRLTEVLAKKECTTVDPSTSLDVPDSGMSNRSLEIQRKSVYLLAFYLRTVSQMERRWWLSVKLLLWKCLVSMAIHNPFPFSPPLKKYLRWMFFLLEQKMGILLSFFPADNVLISLSLYGTASTPCTTRRERKYTFVHGLSPLVELQTNNRHPIWSCLSKLWPDTQQ